MDRVTFGVHWLRFSTRAVLDDVLDTIAATGGGFGPSEERGGFNNPRRFLHDSGAVVYFGSKRDDQPIVVDVPGEACELLHHECLAGWAESLTGRVTRVDLAADVEPPELARSRMNELLATFQAGNCSSRIPSTSVRVYDDFSPGGGRTVYFGSPSSELMLRAYDRRGPLRLEFEVKPAREKKHQVPSALLRYGPAGMWRQFAARCVFAVDWYKKLLAGDASDLAAPVTESTLAKTIESFRQKFGTTLEALMLLGVPLSDLRQKMDNPNAQQVRRWRSWCKQAAELGYDAAELERELERWQR